MSDNRKISVIGLGYVGLPVAVAFGKKSSVVGFDICNERIKELSNGFDRTNEISEQELKQADIRFTCSASELQNADFHIVAVPTPITDAKHPDMRALISASRIIGEQLRKGDIVVYESTVYPGATEGECLPVLEKVSGLIAGEDFHISYSPERINPGDKKHRFTNITKIVSAQDDAARDIIARQYASVIDGGIYQAPSIKVAEAAKVIENTQRDINIALMNQLAMLFDKLNIDTGDVLEAASSKWNFLPFTPGLVGGHCIGIDPYYLSYKAAISGYIPDLILTARAINEGVGVHIASQVVKALIRLGSNGNQSTVTILGLTFKENIPDIRNTRVSDIVHELESYGINIQLHDPVADRSDVSKNFSIVPISLEQLKPADVVIIAVAHDDYRSGEWRLISKLLHNQEGIVYDVKGILPRDSRPEGVILHRL